MKTMHLFAGIGGGLLADKILGHEPIISVEWDGYCCQVLRERAADGWFPGLRVWEGDVRMFDPSEYAGKVDCIHAGFPCQDISVAGNQAGVGHETRSGLYREVLRIAGIVRPRYLFFENVSAILSNGLGTVLADLATMGFAAEWGCIRASDCGAPHHRDRWWCLATNADSQQRSASGMGQDSGTDWRNDPSGVRQMVSDAKSTRQPTRYVPPSQGGGALDGQFRGDGSAMGGHAWSSEPGLGRVANGIPNRIHRLKGLGNAQVPLQAAVAWKLLGGE